MKKSLFFLSFVYCLPLFTACRPDKQETAVKPQHLLSPGARTRLSASKVSLYAEEISIIQNGKIVGAVYIPPKENPSQYVQYWALSSRYVYLNSAPNARFDYVPSATPSKYVTVQDFRTAMKARFGTGKFIIVDTKESLLTGVQSPYI